MTSYKCGLIPYNFLFVCLRHAIFYVPCFNKTYPTSLKANPWSDQPRNNLVGSSLHYYKRLLYNFDFFCENLDASDEVWRQIHKQVREDLILEKLNPTYSE